MPIQCERRVYRGQNCATRRLQREPHQTRAAQHRFRRTLRSDAHDSAMSAMRRRDIKIRVAVESQALRTSEPAIKHGNVAALRYAVHALVARPPPTADLQTPPPTNP